MRHQADKAQATGGSDAQRQMLQIPQPEASIELEADDDSSKAKLTQRALRFVQSQFEERTWIAFWRSAVDGHETQAIADDLGMTRKAVRQAKYRVLRRLRDEIDQLID
jgi:RNA polymerase sigma-70 factor (ECF subfamily)